MKRKRQLKMCNLCNAAGIYGYVISWDSYISERLDSKVKKR